MKIIKSAIPFNVEAVEKYRKKKHLTKRDLSLKLGYNEAFYCVAYNSGEMTLPGLTSLANLMGVSVDELRVIPKPVVQKEDGVVPITHNYNPTVRLVGTTELVTALNSINDTLKQIAENQRLLTELYAKAWLEKEGE